MSRYTAGCPTVFIHTFSDRDFKTHSFHPFPFLSPSQIYVRLFGQDAESWLPCGQIAVPRGEQVSRAIYSNEENVKKGTLRTWAGLRGKESEMEFGYNLKIYPDDVIEVAKKEVEVKGFGGVGKWFSDLLSPVDTSDVKK